ncbi:hypothetical protein K438DRAFT_1775184 [Mycena galopus ATCC 62051]|nr:hypothetical protein K438DRAFT_1775184 [Mycena galopus ATCC 62051]
MSEAVRSSDTIFRISDTFRKSNTILRISNTLMYHSGNPTRGHGSPVVAWARNQELFLDTHWVDLDDLKSWLHTKHLSSYLLEHESSEGIGACVLPFLNHSRKLAAFTVHSEAPPSRIMSAESSGAPVIIPESGRSFEFLAKFPDEYHALYGDTEPAYISAFSHYS